MSPLTRRQFLLTTGLTGLAGASGLLGGCARPTAASAQSGEVGVQIATNDPNYLTYFTGWAETLSQTPGTYQYNLRTFLESTDQVVTKLLTSYMSGTDLPNMPGLEISQFSRLQRQNLAGNMLVNLKTVIPNLQQDYFQSRLTPYTSSGGIYGLESDMCLCVYYYREDLFQKYNISTNFETWDDLIKIGTDAKTKHGVSVGAVGDNDLTWMAMLLFQQGGNFFDLDGNLTLDSPESVTAIQTLLDGINSGAFAFYNAFYGAPAASDLNADKIAGYFMPDWYLPFVLKNNAPTQTGKWRMRVMPRFASGSPTSVWGGTGFAVVKDQAGTQATVDLLKAAYNTQEGQVQRFLKANYLPTMKAAWTDQRIINFENDYLGGQKPYEVFSTIVDKAPTMITNEYWDVMTGEMNIALSDAVLGKATPAQAIKTASSAIASQMKGI